ncbi:dihydrodipicolinate synthase family protein [Pseudonocardiaceae bacterium YIM PH 21723]|nr:dihydrodipicolinate synthase family protein [Pseudonocardiaceae bacterium YIM PH 21723]
MTYSGTIVPLITPLTTGRAVCESSVDRLIGSIHGAVTALMPVLSSGEGWKLDETQWTDMVRYTRRYSRGLPVLAGIQLPSTDEVIARAQLAAELGADGIVVTTPFSPDLGQPEILRHYRRIRAATPMPIFLYNEAALSGNTIEPATLKRICELPGIVGIKESSGSAELTLRLVAELPGLPVFEGWENLLFEARGVAGFVGPLANLEPGLCNAMLADPTARGQGEIDAVCERLGLYKDDWYLWAKRELLRRGVIETDLGVDS